MRASRPWLTLASGVVVMMAFGSVHAFSVFLLSLETLFAADRAAVSLVYSLALIGLTGAVLFGHRIYARFSPPVLLGGASLVAAAGLVVSATSSSLMGIYAGYGLMYGVANGLAYGFLLQLVAQAFPQIRGLAIGVITGAYAIGAVIFAKIISISLTHYSVGQTFGVMAGFLGLLAVVVWFALNFSGASYVGETKFGAQCGSRDPMVSRMWLAYGLGSLAGLMAIGHATGIVVEAGGSNSMMVTGAIVIGLGNGIAGVVAGYLSDCVSMKRLLVGLPLLSAAASMALLLVSEPWTTVLVLAVIGFAYGAIIAVYPTAVATFFGALRAARVYGVVFTSWGAAGVAGPWMAGFLYDFTGTYSWALVLAAVAGIGSALFAGKLPRVSD